MKQLISSILTDYWSDFNILFVKSKGKSDQTLKQTAWKRPVKTRATIAITELYATNEIMIKNTFYFWTGLLELNIICHSIAIYGMFEKWFWRVYLRFQCLCNTYGKIWHGYLKIVAYQEP